METKEMKEEFNTHTYEGLSISPDEYSRIYYGELTDCDFCTCAPNPSNIFKTAIGIERYLKYKKKHMNEMKG